MSNRAKEIAAIMATYEPGQVWEMKGKCNTEWVTCHVAPWWDWHSNDYRRKPEPKTRPMRPDEWPPVGTPVRASGSGKVSLVVIKYNKEAALVTYSDGLRTANELASGYEFSLDGEKTWLPFTVTEQA